MKDNKDNDVLYITLIDFLLQLIFLGLVVGTIYAVATGGEGSNKEDENVQKLLEKIKKTTGVSDITELTDLHTRMGPIKEVYKKVQEYNKIEKEIKQVGGIDKVKNLLQGKIQKGQGSPSCLEDEKPIVVFHAYRDRIEIKENTELFNKHVLSKLGLSLNDVKRLELQKFTEIFAGLKNSKLPDGSYCKYNVKVCEYSDSVRPRDRIREIFWIKSIETC